MTNKKREITIIKEQYSQYYQMVRMHLKFSWQIPSFVIISLLFILSLESKNIEDWKNFPEWPAFGFFIVGFFLVVMFVHHKRNLFYADHYQKILAKIEKNWGIAVKVHHFQVEIDRGWWQKISSSLCLSIFLIVMITSSFGMSIYYFLLVMGM